MSAKGPRPDFEAKLKGVMEAVLLADWARYVAFLPLAGVAIYGEVIDSWRRTADLPKKGYWRRLLDYWGQVGRDLRHNLSVAWPIFVVLIVFVGFSAYALYLAEHGRDGSGIHTGWDALYFTWVTMATVDHVKAVDWNAQALTSLDALMGLLTIGVIVWLITKSLTQTRADDRLVLLGEGLQATFVKMIEEIHRTVPARASDASPGTDPEVPNPATGSPDTEPASEISMMNEPGSAVPQQTRRVRGHERGKQDREDSSGH